MSTSNVEITWPAVRSARTGKATVAPLRTGGFLQTVFASTALAGTHLRHSRNLDVSHEPWFAGYCLDAPDFLAAGSHKARRGNVAPEMSACDR